MWYLEALDSIKIPNNIRPLVEFESNGNIHGNNGCNVFSGFYQLGSSNKFTALSLLQTLKGCEGEAGQIENQMMEILYDANHYKAAGDVLILFTCDKVLAKFKAGA